MEQVCAGILRRYGAAIGLPPTFTIYGTDEQVRFFGLELKSVSSIEQVLSATSYIVAKVLWVTEFLQCEVHTIAFYRSSAPPSLVHCSPESLVTDKCEATPKFVLTYPSSQTLR
jgi:hypothetical protein